MKHGVFSLAAAVLVTAAASASASTNISGYVKSFAVLQDSIDTPVISLPTAWQSQNSLRLMAERFGESTVTQFHYELSPVLQSRDLAALGRTFNVVSGSYRLTDPTGVINDETDKNRWYQNLDRFNIQWQLNAGDLTVGRQAISLGSARIINPTDVFLPFDVQTFNTEYRTGVDAIRFQRPLGDLGEFDVGIVLGEDAREENSAAFVQVRTNVNGMDLQFAAIRFAEHTLTGGGVQTSLGDFGFWFEIAGVSGDDSYARASTGFDYAFNEFVFGQVEYHFNGAGSDEPGDYLGLIDDIAYNRGGVFLLGKHYLMPSVSIQAGALWTIGLQAIANLSDDSVFTSVSAARSLTDNLYMDLGVYLFAGDELTLDTTGPVLRSEYGTNPATVYASLRYYF